MNFKFYQLFYFFHLDVILSGDNLITKIYSRYQGSVSGKSLLKIIH